MYSCYDFELSVCPFISVAVHLRSVMLLVVDVWMCSDALLLLLVAVLTLVVVAGKMQILQYAIDLD